MKDLKNMAVEELGALVCEALRAAGIIVTLTGGSCVAIWSSGKYVSHDLDFIEEGPVPRRKVVEVMRGLGFEAEGRHFIHPESPYLVEFPTGPLMVGDERVQRVTLRQTSAGALRLLSPTDCVKDRLAAYYHWNDRQALEQAVMVAQAQDVDLSDIRRWSEAEGNAAKFEIFRIRASAGQDRL
jgi:hypothetical protein